MLISAVFHYRHEIQTVVEKLSDFFFANYNFCSFDLTCPQKTFFFNDCFIQIWRFC